MSYAKRILAEPLRSLGFASIGATYTAVGTALAFPSRIVSIKNMTNASVIFSYDGTNNNEILPASSAMILDFTTNRVNVEGIFFGEGTVIYAKQGPDGAPGSGSVYISSYYGKGD